MNLTTHLHLERKSRKNSSLGDAKLIKHRNKCTFSFTSSCTVICEEAGLADVDMKARSRGRMSTCALFCLLSTSRPHAVPNRENDSGDRFLLAGTSYLLGMKRHYLLQGNCRITISVYFALQADLRASTISSSRNIILAVNLALHLVGRKRHS